jgi:hypothetical protein
MHITAEELIDLAEGTREESSAPHLRTCGQCRDQLAALRAATSAAADVEVPEPSPLFWEHLSARVHDAVAAEGVPPARFLNWRRAKPLLSWRGWAVAGVTAAVMIATYVTTPWPPESAESVQEMSAIPSPAETIPLPVAAAGDDPSLALVADLTAQLDADAFDGAEWTSHAGAVDQAVVNLTEDERLELQRLLNEELAKS